MNRPSCVHSGDICAGCSMPSQRNMGSDRRAREVSHSDGFGSFAHEGGFFMAEGMKSALELALERTEHVRKTIHEEGLSLTDGQREQLAELEREYGAKIAEKDVMLQAE